MFSFIQATVESPAIFLRIIVLIIMLLLS